VKRVDDRRYLNCLPAALYRERHKVVGHCMFTILPMNATVCVYESDVLTVRNSSSRAAHTNLLSGSCLVSSLMKPASTEDTKRVALLSQQRSRVRKALEKFAGSVVLL
jgi:hypothetical protein